MIKKKIISAVMILFLLLLLFFLWWGAKKEKTATSNQTEIYSEEQGGISAEEKIFAALDKGEISRSEAAILSIKAAFKPTELKEKYRSQVLFSGRTNLNVEMQWLINHWDELSLSEQAEVEPYIVAPDNPKYFLNENKSGGLNFVSPVMAADSWQRISFDIHTNHGDYEGLGQINYQSGGEQAANQLNNALQKSWNKFVALLRINPLNFKPFKIYLTDTGSDYGLAFWKESNNFAQCEIRINNQSGFANYLDTTLAHELFHCFQYNFAPVYYNSSATDVTWLKEATATWAENFVYPQINSEHQFLPSYFNNYRKGLISTQGVREYGAYVWFFFLSQYLGRDDHIYNVLNLAKDGQIKKAVRKAVSGYADSFAEFGAYNWNQEPSERYQDLPNFPKITPKNVAKIEAYEPNQFNTEEDMPPGSFRYFHYFFGPDLGTVKKVRFDFFQPEKGEQRRIAFVKTGNRWEREEWSSLEKREFCRRDESERVREIVLAIANTDLENSQELFFSVDLTEDCAAKKKGSLKIHELSTLPGGLKTVDVTLNLEETVVYDPNKEAYVVVARRADCHSSDVTTTQVIDRQLKAVITGNGSINEEYELDGKNDIRFFLSKDGKGGYIATELNPKNPNWVTYTNKITSADTFTEQNSCLGTWEASYDLKPEEIKEDRIKGHRVINFPGRTITIDFDYSLP